MAKNTKGKRSGKKNKRILRILLGIIIVSVIGGGSAVTFNLINKANREKADAAKKLDDAKDVAEKEVIEKEKIEKKEVLISAAGDCILGTDTNFSQSNSLPTAVADSGNDYSYLFKNVYDIFSKDDYTIVNLENPFTDASEKQYKGEGRVFHFKGPKEYTNILKEGSVEGVTIANNHIYDYGSQGFNDTVNALSEANIDFCGEGYEILTEIKGIKFAFLGYQGWNDTKELRDKIKGDIDRLRNEGVSVVIPYFHWGIERDNLPYSTQVNLARYSIDVGADMVLGSHPHVIQSLENYKGKLIAYSLSNFSFGGNSNPLDKRTFIAQVKFDFENDKVVGTQYKIIPALISSVEYKNDYVPTPAVGELKTKIFNDLNEISPTLNGKIGDDFISLD